MPESMSPLSLDRAFFEHEFGKELVATMDDIAQLVQIGRDMQSMSSTFKNNTDLDRDAARLPARAIIKAVRSAAGELLAEAFRGGKVRRDELSQIRARRLRSLRRAQKNAETLAAQEREAQNTGVLELRVQRSLEGLISRWEQRAPKAS